MELSQEDRDDLRNDDLREDAEQADRAELEDLEKKDYILTGEWDEEPIYRPMTVAERYFRDLHEKGQNKKH